MGKLIGVGTIPGIVAIAGVAFAAVTVRYENDDDQTHNGRGESCHAAAPLLPR